MRPDLSSGAWFAARTPGRRALSAAERRRTYAEMQARVERLANLLSSLGVRDGERVADVGANDPCAYELLVAASVTGAITWPVSSFRSGLCVLPRNGAGKVLRGKLKPRH